MDQRASGIWNELVDEFRALGGTLDNVHLGYGEFGRGLFVIDPAQPFLVHTPENLLVNASDIIFENGILKVAPGAHVGARERKFYEDYYAHISWAGGGRKEIEDVFEQAAELPSELRGKLVEEYVCGLWFLEPSPALIQQVFLESREVSFNGRMVMMPMVELANHGTICLYDDTGGLSLKGTSKSEITVRYNATDTLGIFLAWGFVAPSDMAFSIALEGAVGTTPLHIHRHMVDMTIGQRPILPTLTTCDSGALQLSYLMLGNRKMPRLCRGNFRSVMRTAGYNNVDETFDRIRMLNQAHLLTLLGDLEMLDGRMVLQLRRMVRLQLLALAYCFGVREF